MIRVSRGFVAFLGFFLLGSLVLMATRPARSRPIVEQSTPIPTTNLPVATLAPLPERLPFDDLIGDSQLTLERRPPTPAPTLVPTATPIPTLPPPGWIGGQGPAMRGTLAAQTERLDLYIGRGTYSVEQMEAFAPDFEWALQQVEERFGERIYRRISLGFYPLTSPYLRGIAYTDQGRAEVYVASGEPYENIIAVVMHELAHHLQAQRYGKNVQSMSDTILLEGAATWIAGDYWLPKVGASSWRERARQIHAKGVPLQLVTAERYGANNAYELWASFVDFLLDQYGFPVYRDLYKSGRGRALGSSDYQRVTGKTLNQLAEEWRAWVGK
jgi:hypothetical protein